MGKQELLLAMELPFCKLWANLDSRAPDIPFMHCRMDSWGKQERIKYLELWRSFQDILRTLDYSYACVIISDDNRKLYKFCKMSGMQEAMRINSKILMYKEL